MPVQVQCWEVFMDYELIFKFVGIVLGSTGVIVALTKVAIAYIRRNNDKKITIKKGENEDYELVLQGYTMPETESFFKKLPRMIKESDKPTMKLLNPKKD